MTLASYFSSPEKRTLLADAASAWLGTPFRAHSAVRGAGVDCVFLCAEVMRSSGVIDTYAFPPYALDHAKHQEQSLLLAWLDASPHFLHLPPAKPNSAGDLALFQIGRCVHHAGVMLDARRFIHALEGPGVIISQLDDPTWSKRLHGFYRPLPSSLVIGHS